MKRLGLYLSPGRLYLAEAALEPGGLSVLRSASSSWGGEHPSKAALGSLDSEAFQPQALAEALRTALESLGSHEKRIAVTLSSQACLLRFFLMPKVDRRFWSKAVVLEAKKYVPFSLEGLTSDFTVLKTLKQAEGERMEVLFAAAPKALIENLGRVLAQLGLVPAVLEPEDCSVARLFQSLQSGGLPAQGFSAHVHFDPFRAHVLLRSQGCPVLSRHIDLSDESSGMGGRSLDVAGAVEFAENQLSRPQPQKIWITGFKKMQVHESMVSEESPVPVERLELEKSSGIAEAEWGVLAAAGAALSASGKTAPLVDLSHQGEQKEEKKAVFSIYFAGAALSGLFLLLSLVQSYRANLSAAEIRRLKFENQGRTLLEGLTPDQIQQELAAVQQRVSFMERSAQPALMASKFLEKLSEKVPAVIWLTRVEYYDELSVGQGVRKLAVSGYVQTGDFKSDVETANGFKGQLEQDPAFKGSKIQISFPKLTAEKTGASGGPQEEEGVNRFEMEFQFPGTGAP